MTTARRASPTRNPRAAAAAPPSTHAALVRAAKQLSGVAAAQRVLDAYLAGAVFARRTKLASLFKRCLSKAEVDAAIAALVASGRAELAVVDGKAAIVTAR